MFPLKNLLFATDFSDIAHYAFQLVLSMARDYGAKVILVHVVPNPTVAFGEVIETHSVEDEKRGAEFQLRQFRDEAEKAGVQVEARLLVANPVDGILYVASEHNADLIVVGTHGRTGLSRLLMGSVAEQILRKAPCPVLTIKAPMAEPVETVPIEESTAV